MGLAAGIVGLPNVGKSTLFNAVTNSNVEAANYPFATIEPNVGVVKIVDERLTKIASLINPKKLTYATCTFVDIAGLVKGASNGEGLGNKFLANIREVNAICHVVRCFDDSNITHVYNSVDPVRDAEVINLELILSDLEVLEKRFQKVLSNARTGKPEYIAEEKIVRSMINTLKDSKFVNLNSFSAEEQKIIKGYNLLTVKPMLYVANVNEDDITDPENNPNFKKLKQWVEAQNNNSLVIALSVNLEFEISKLSDEEKELFVADLGIKESGLNTLARSTYKLLNLSSFFTFGADETKAWTFVNGMTAPQCAGIIHTDFEKGFIRAEVMKSEDLITLGSENAVKDSGKLKSEGKDYVVKDGDVILFRFNVSK